MPPAKQPVLRRRRLRQGGKPAQHGRKLPLLDEERVMARHELDRGVDVAGRGRVFGRIDNQACVAIPGAGPSVQNRHHVSIGRGELVLQQLAEQLVVAVPLALRVERHEQRVRTFQLRQQRGRARTIEHRVAQVTAHTVEDRGLQEERAQLRCLAREDVAGQVVDEIAIVAGELLDEGARITSTAQ